jgi:hypothetical protein
VPDRVSFRAAYERFPASVKGAFVLRGADGMPHQVRIEHARAAECSGRDEHEIGVEPSVLEVAPTLDLFVPFELPTVDLGAGWYQLECEVVIDGSPAVVRPGNRFAIPWARSAVRRGTVQIGEKAGEVALEQLDCAGDSIRLTYVAAHEPNLKLTVDGSPHQVLEVDHDEGSGRGRIVAYPALRGQERLSIEVRGAVAVEVALP